MSDKLEELLIIDKGSRESFAFWNDGTLSSYAVWFDNEVDIDLTKDETYRLYAAMKRYYESEL